MSFNTVRFIKQSIKEENHLDLRKVNKDSSNDCRHQNKKETQYIELSVKKERNQSQDQEQGRIIEALNKEQSQLEEDG